MKRFTALLFSLIMTVSIVPAKAFSLKPQNVEETSILDKAPVDLVYCYADLRDPNLHRGELDNSIKKDYDNDELRYSLRSVLQNIPWIRKIFIIMPNEKVRFLKEPEEISDKIVYVKNQDLLGFDTNSVFVKKMNMWKLKDFGCSNHIIYMDDDFFIGKPMKKSDFFYVDNNKVVPYVLYNKSVGYGQYDGIKAYHDELGSKLKGNDFKNHLGFNYLRMSSLLFLYKCFDKDLLMPIGKFYYFPHNAFAENLDENKEIYDLVKNKYEGQNKFLNELYRSKYSLVNCELYNFYVLNKYKRKINKIPMEWLDLACVKNHSYDSKLFCFNYNGSRRYTEQDYSNETLMMMKLFPNKTKYEIPD